MPVRANDQSLPVAGARAGDPEAWDTLFRRHQLPLFSWIQELVRHEQTSLDITQETFIRAVRHIGSLREDRKFGSWLFGIAHQLVRAHFRKAGKHELLVGDGEIEALPAPEDNARDLLVRAEDEAAFWSALEELSDAHRAVVLLHFIEDFSLREISEITGAPEGTVKSRLWFARKHLKQVLQQTDENPA